MDLRHQNKQGASLSPAVWNDIPYEQQRLFRHKGIFFFDDFLTAPTFASNTGQAPYITIQDTGVTIKGETTLPGGIMEIAGADAANDDGGLQHGLNVTGLGFIDKTKPYDVAFEARWRTPSVADVSHFIGLGKPGRAVAGTLADSTGALVDKDLIGFHSLTAAPTTLKFVYRKEGQTAVDAVATALTFAADTWYKLGFRYRAKNKRLTAYVDGEEVGYVNLASATTFPSAVLMSPLWFLKAHTTAEKKALLDWWAFSMHNYDE